MWIIWVHVHIFVPLSMIITWMMRVWWKWYSWTITRCWSTWKWSSWRPRVIRVHFLLLFFLLLLQNLLRVLKRSYYCWSRPEFGKTIKKKIKINSVIFFTSLLHVLHIGIYICNTSLILFQLLLLFYRFIVYGLRWWGVFSIFLKFFLFSFFNLIKHLLR